MLRIIIMTLLAMPIQVLAQDLLSVPVRFETELSSEMFTKKHKDKFEIPRAVVAQDILDVDGNVFIREGSDVVVSVDAKRRKNLVRRGKINFTLESVQDVDGRLIPLGASFNIVGRKKASFIGHAFSGELVKKHSDFAISGTGVAVMAAVGGVAVASGAVALVATGVYATVQNAIYKFNVASQIPEGGAFNYQHAVDIVDGAFSRSILNRGKTTVNVLAGGSLLVAATAATVAAGAATTLIVLAATKGKAAVVEAGTIWNVVIPHQQT